MYYCNQELLFSVSVFSDTGRFNRFELILYNNAFTSPALVEFVFLGLSRTCQFRSSQRSPSTCISTIELEGSMAKGPVKTTKILMSSLSFPTHVLVFEVMQTLDKSYYLINGLGMCMTEIVCKIFQYKETSTLLWTATIPECEEVAGTSGTPCRFCITKDDSPCIASTATGVCE